MPILSVYKGDSELSFLYYKSASDFKLYRFSYAYLPNVFDFSEKEYYDQVLQLVGKELGFSTTGCEFITTSYPKSDFLGETGKFDICLSESLKSFSGCTCVYVDRFKLITSESASSYCPSPAALNYDIANLYSNWQLYPHVRPSNDVEMEDLDSLVREISLESKVDIKKKRPVLVSGSRFCEEKPDVLAYLLIFDLVRQPGLFDLRIDVQNALPVLATLNSFDSNLYGSMHFDFPKYGSVLNAGGGVECLFESYSGKTQLISVNKDEIFIMKLGKGESARVVVKNSVLGSFESEVTGGEIGFLIDARDKEGKDFLKDAYRQRYLSAWKKVLSENIGGF